MDSDRDRRDQKQHGHEDEDDREGDLEAGALPFQALVLRRGKMGLIAMLQHPRLDIAPDKKIQLVDIVEADERAHPLLLVVRDYDDLALAGAAKRILADLLEAEREGEAGAGH